MRYTKRERELLGDLFNISLQVSVIPIPPSIEQPDQIAIDLSSTSNGSTRVDVTVTGTFTDRDFLFEIRR